MSRKKKQLNWEELSQDMLELFRDLLKDADEIEVSSGGKHIGSISFDRAFLDEERKRWRGAGHKVHKQIKQAQANRPRHKTGAIPPGAVQ